MSWLGSLRGAASRGSMNRIDRFFGLRGEAKVKFLEGSATTLGELQTFLGDAEKLIQPLPAAGDAAEIVKAVVEALEEHRSSGGKVLAFMSSELISG